MAKYVTITKFSKLTGVTIRTLHYYDKEGILTPHHKSDAGYRFYSKNEMLSLQKINILKYIGFNLNQIKTILKSDTFDWQSSLNLQVKILQKNIEQLQDGIMLINYSMNKFVINHREPDWKIMEKILEVLKMKQDNVYQNWIKRNFTNEDLFFWGEVASSQNNEENDKLWKKIFEETKSVMHLSISDPQVKKIVWTVINSANDLYPNNKILRDKMWNLMKSGDIPKGFMPGYEKEIVLFIDKAIIEMVKNDNK